MTLRTLMLLLLPATIHSWAQVPVTAAEIMARVAANQDVAEAERAHYVYVQHARIASRRGGTVLCEEVTDDRVTPVASGSQRQLLKLNGRLLVKKKYVLYTTLPESHEKADDQRNDTIEIRSGSTDQDLVEHLRKNLTNDTSKDGLQAGLFPLSSKARSQYDFTLKGLERRNGRDTFHILFTPRDKDDFGWRGDAWIDVEKFEPVAIQTALGKNIPFAVRTLLGTSVPGLGFSAVYAEQPDGVWFPVSFGSEFKINVLFFFHRTITLAVVNRGFQKTHVASRIVENSVPSAQPNPSNPELAKP